MKKFFNKVLTIRIEKNLYLISWIILLILGFIFIYNLEKILPDKYFYDSRSILKMIKIEDFYERSGDSYGLTAYIFSFIPLKTLKQFNVYIYIVFILFFIKLILNSSREVKFYIINFMYLFLSIIYLIRPGKEILQLGILGLCYFFRKYIPIFLLISGILFRHYLIIQAGIYLGIWFLLKKRKKKLWIVLLIIIFILINIKFPQILIKIFTIRDFVNKGRLNANDAKSIIVNIFQSELIIVCYINYFINFIRLLLPIELLFKSIKYIPYIFFQIYLSLKLWELRKKMNNEYVILLYSFILVSVIFEPDFGSFLRHTVPYFIFIINLLKEERKR